MWILIDDEEIKRRKQLRDTAKKQRKSAGKHVSNELLKE